MRHLKLSFLFFAIGCSVIQTVVAQDPHFSQFFMAPQLINPALTGFGYGKWRVMGNVRQQWGNASTPFNTQVFAADYKVRETETGYLVRNEYQKNVLAIGGYFMNDRSMFGAFKSIYAGGSLSYNIHISPSSQIAAGFQASYGNRRVDYSRLTFAQQFTSGGFDISLPTGEKSLQAMKPFYSLASGILYNYHNDITEVDIGAAVFDINEPKQTFIDDPRQELKRRYVFHANVEREIADNLILKVNSIFHLQVVQNYFAVGGCLGMNVTEERGKYMVYGGAWFREGDAIYPFAAIQIKNLLVGLSYDVTVSKQNLGPNNPHSFELSFLFTDPSNPDRDRTTICNIP
jgi:type IX secretion system PorP/SprF family membrane protein